MSFDIIVEPGLCCASEVPDVQWNQEDQWEKTRLEKSGIVEIGTQKGVQQSLTPDHKRDTQA